MLGSILVLSLFCCRDTAQESRLIIAGNAGAARVCPHSFSLKKGTILHRDLILNVTSGTYNEEYCYEYNTVMYVCIIVISIHKAMWSDMCVWICRVDDSNFITIQCQQLHSGSNFNNVKRNIQTAVCNNIHRSCWSLSSLGEPALRTHK